MCVQGFGLKTPTIYRSNNTHTCISLHVHICVYIYIYTYIYIIQICSSILWSIVYTGVGCKTWIYGMGVKDFGYDAGLRVKACRLSGAEGSMKA